MVSKATCAPAWVSLTARRMLNAQISANNAHPQAKRRPRIAPGPLLSKVVRPPKGMSIFAAAFRSSHVIGAGTSVALIRWIRRAAFVGPAARARPCGHAFFMLRFLAGGSAGTDGSLTGRAGRGLALSRRNQRRTEERRNDKGRDCKFGSHQECLRGVTGSVQTSAGDLVPVRDQHCANFIFQRTRLPKNSFVAAAQQSSPYKHLSRSEHRICAKQFH